MPINNQYLKERSQVLRLITRATVALGAVFILLLLGVGLVVDRSFVKRNEAVMNNEVMTLRGIIESIMENPSKLKRDKVEGYLIGLARSRQMANVRIFSTDTTIAFSADTSEAGRKVLLRREPECAICHNDSLKMATAERIYQGDNGERFYHFTLPIENRKVCGKCHDSDEPLRGNLVADFSLAELDQSIATTRRRLVVLLSVVFVLIVTALLFWLRRSVYHPLSAIAGRLSAIASGQFASQQTVRQSNIMGSLNEHIDRMALTLRDSYERLEEAVQERTISLRKSQQELESEKDKLKLIFDNSPEAIIGLSLDGIVQFANGRVTEYVDISADNLVGSAVRDWSELCQIVTGEVAQRAQTDTAESGISVGVERVMSANGSEREYDVQARTVVAEDGNSLLLVMFSDATLRRKVEANLHRHERLASLGQLAAGVAHEVGNPLSAISSVAQLMRSHPDPESSDHNLDLISYHIQRISKIVRSLSDLARRPSEDASLSLISAIVADVIEITSFDHRARNVEFSQEIPDDESEIRVVRDQLMQALLNIMMNALDASTESVNPHIKVHLSQTADETVIAISDNGCGMDSETQRRIFEPFFTTKSEGKGTGLGMFITHRIITQMGGTLDVTSELGSGTKFTITLNHAELM